MTPEIPIRLRVYPLALRKAVPGRRDDWPTQAIVCHSLRDRDGAATVSVLLELFEGRPVVECLVHHNPTAASDLDAYVAVHRSAVVAGAPDRLRLISAATSKIDGGWDGLGYRLRDRSYRRGWVLVFERLPEQLPAIAAHWAPQRKTPGAWSFVFVGLGRKTPSGFRKFSDAPSVTLTRAGQQTVAWWGTTRYEDQDPDVPPKRPPPRTGPIVDVLRAAAALLGVDIYGLADACRRFGIQPPGDHPDPLDRLRAEARVIASLYRAEVAEIQRLGLGLDLGNLTSTGGIGAALFREAGLV